MSPTSDVEFLKSIPSEQAHQVLVTLCGDNWVRLRAVSFAKKLQRAAASREKSKSNLAICARCRTAFNQDDKDAKACQDHDGDMDEDPEIDFYVDVWEGDPEVNMDEMREESPEKFIWSCCKERGDSEGCKTGAHEADLSKADRGSYAKDGDK
ncbi:hypothetical protein HIM_02774 [Hirsutella minnesotensis 3608]|nr:hypothetical protein HIM_02774 [Hirsutella minnesotensis 3608]